LLQGAGIFFNRIAGPFDPFNGTGTPNFDGVVLARIRTDVSLADFEAGVRNLVNDVEGAYWNLYFAYRNLEARKVGRDSALQTWRKVKALFDANAKGGEADKEAQAREQYFFFRGEVETALSDLFRAESRLRYMMGLAATDGRLISTSTEPSTARTTFDWNQIHGESLIRTVELRQQRWRIKQRELELMASKNLLLPRLDAVARYRWLGMGENWLDADGTAFSPATGGSILGTDAFSTLADGDFQESEVGLQFNMPIGFRRELATVREQQLLLARERSILQDQELEQSHALAEAVRVLDTSYTLMQTNFNRAVAAQRQVEAVQAAYDVGTVTLDLLLDAQRRLADALSSGYRAQADYNRNIAQVHFRKGSLLEYNGVYLAEGPWPAKAYFDAHRRARARDAAFYLDYGFTRPDVVSLGPVDEHGPGEMVHDGAIIHEGPIESIPVPATPSVIPAEELPPPVTGVGPVSSRQRAKAGANSQAAANPADFKGGRFDWQMDDNKAKATAKSVVASSKPTKTPAPATKDDDVAEDGPLLTPPATEPPKNTKWRDPNVRAASAEIPVSSGWKKSER
jgi:outer membrane protein TolC